ncbi:MAG: penicillin-binding protein activator [Steroidobacteraceae bacterium]
MLNACAPLEYFPKPPNTRTVVKPERSPAAPAASAQTGDRMARNRARIALLLPLTGAAAPAGEAVRTGFLDGFYAWPESTRPSVRIYDVSLSDASSTYLRAAADGAQVVVGPLTRAEVEALAETTDGRLTTLALNFLPVQRAVPKGFYQFALSPEDEARAVARRVVADGLPTGVTLVPANDWGRRVQSAFSKELSLRGGVVLDAEVYAPGTTDFSEVIPRLMKLRPAGRSVGKRVYQPRADARFIFMAGQPVTARLIRSQLRFNFAGRIPAYSLSDAYEPGNQDNLDLDGMIFPDMPWILEPFGPVAAQRDAAIRDWRSIGDPAGRLHAFGVDAFAAVMELRKGSSAFERPLNGVSGELHMDSNGLIRRKLSFARIDDGEPTRID